MEVLTLAITGALVSLLVQVIKSSSVKWFVGPRTLVIMYSLLAGLVYFFIKDNEAVLQSAGTVLLFANAVYGFIISYFEDADPSLDEMDPQ